MAEMESGVSISIVSRYVAVTTISSTIPSSSAASSSSSSDWAVAGRQSTMPITANAAMLKLRQFVE